MVKDMFGYEHPPSSCCGAAIISSMFMNISIPVCDNCGEPVRHKDKLAKAKKLKEIEEAKNNE